MKEFAAVLIASCAAGACGPARAEPYKPYQFGLWALTPTVELNAIFKDNVYGSQLRKVSAGGIEITPSFTLSRDTGLHLTTFSVSETAAFFPGHTDADTHAERIGLAHVFRPWREQSFSFNASYSQSFGGAQAPGGGLIATNASGDIKAGQVGVATERTFGRLATTFSANASTSDVSNANGAPIIIASNPTTDPNAPGQAPAGLFSALPSGRSSTYSATLGASYVGPFLTPFASVGVTSQSQTGGSTQSLQIQSGVSTGRWRLYRGEIHVGYLISSTDRVLVGLPAQQSDTHSPSIGGSITWDPLRYLSVSVGANAQFGAITLPSIVTVVAPANSGSVAGTADPAAPPASTTTATPAGTAPGTVLPAGDGGSTLSVNGSMNYSFSRRWTAMAGFGYSILRTATQRTVVETANLGASYNWTRLSDFTLSYAYTRSDANLGPVLGLPGATGPLVSNVVRAGLRQRF